MSSESEMTKETSSGSTPLSVFYRYPRLMQGLSVFSGLGVLSSGLVVAQTNSLVDTGAAPPKAPVAPAIQAAPAPIPEPPARPKPAAPEPIVERAVRVREPAPAPAALAPAPVREPKAPAPVREPKAPAPVREPKAPAPVRETEPIVRRKPALAAPNLSLPDAATVAKPPKLFINPAQIQESAKSPIPPTNNYIDRTDYSIGATRRSDGPDRVLLTERSSGCSTVSQNGQLASGACGVAAPSQQMASQKPATQQTASQVIANLERTLREPRLGGIPRLPMPQVVGSQPVNLGPLRLSPSAISGSQPTTYPSYSPSPSYSSSPSYSPSPSYSSSPSYSPSPSYSTYSSSSSPLPSSLAYYNLTRRPEQRLSVGKTSFMFPLTIPSEITSIFGWRIHPITGDQRFHSGTDLGAPEGTPVVAAVSGQVVTADFLGGYGLTVILQHEKGTQESLYAHLSELFVKPGDMVEQGNVIGRVGSTGNSTGPHLHFEWRHLTPDGWVTVDAGAHLQYSLAQFIRALQIAQTAPQRGT